MLLAEDHRCLNLTSEARNPVADKGYEFFDHTADVGLRVWGGTLDELFARAAAALTSLLVEESAVASSQTRSVELHASSVESLLRVWLSEVLVWFSTERFLVGTCALTVTPTELSGSVQGEIFETSRHRYGTEVKGVTRHQLSVTQEAGRWTAQVIFDV